jgi:Tol biopolymer transport system component
MFPALSPDGRLLAYMKAGPQQSDIWVYNLETKSPLPPHAESTPASLSDTRLTFDGRPRGISSWAPDGKHILYTAGSGDRYSIQWIRATGGEQPWGLYDSSARLASPVISPDGRWLVFTAVAPATLADIWAAPLDQSDPEHPKAGPAEPIIQTAAIENLGRISPDGNWLAYQSTESGGRTEIFVQRFTAHNNTAAGKWQITTEGCAFPVWARSGRRLYFMRLDEQAVMFVDYTSDGGSFRTGQPRRLIAAAPTGAQPLPRVGDGGTYYDVAPDGRRVIMVPSDDDSGEAGRAPRAMLVLNWAEELRRRVPAGVR